MGLPRRPRLPSSARGASVPIVPAAILFDLGFGGRQDGPASRPIARSAAGAEQRRPDFALGNAGAGLGAVAGRLKGGLGSASLALTDGSTVGALVAVNSWGSVVRPDCGRLGRPIGARRRDRRAAGDPDASLDPEISRNALRPSPGQYDDRGRRDRCRARQGRLPRLAIMAQDGIARAIRPVHTPFDGDTVFALSTGDGPASDPAALARLGSAAAAAWRAPSCARCWRPSRSAAFRAGVSYGEVERERAFSCRRSPDNGTSGTTFDRKDGIRACVRSALQYAPGGRVSASWFSAPRAGQKQWSRSPNEPAESTPAYICSSPPERSRPTRILQVPGVSGGQPAARRFECPRCIGAESDRQPTIPTRSLALRRCSNKARCSLSSR